MSNYMKLFKKEFEKYARPAPVRKSRQTAPAPTGTPAAAPATTTTAPAAPGSRAPHRGQPRKPTAPTGGGGTSVPVNTDVRKMQEAILHLADVASSTDVTSMAGNKEGRMTGEQTRQVPKVDMSGPEGTVPRAPFMNEDQQSKLNEDTKDDKNYLGGSDPFGNFIVQNYIDKNSYTGKQYLNTDVAGETNRQSATMNPTNLRGIIDTIKRVGSPNLKGEKTVDGLWQTRTNNSLHVIGDLVAAMLGFTKDLNMQIPGYNEKYLDVYKSLIPQAYTDLKSGEDISARAKALLPHLAAMTKFFEGMNSYVFNNQDIRKYIDQKEPFEKYQKGPQIPPEMRAAGIPGLTFNWIDVPNQNWISLNELSSLDNFKNFLKRVRISDTDPESIKKVLDLVAQKINTSNNDPGY